MPVGPCLSVAITNSGLPGPVLQADGHWDCEQVVDQNVSLFLSYSTASTQDQVQVLPCELRGLSQDLTVAGSHSVLRDNSWHILALLK